MLSFLSPVLPDLSSNHVPWTETNNNFERLTILPRNPVVQCAEDITENLKLRL
jgi:hypothetical protein